MTCRIAQSQNEGFKELKTYSEMISEINNEKPTDNRTEEEIIEDVLNDFKRYEEERVE